MSGEVTRIRTKDGVSRPIDYRSLANKPTRLSQFTNDLVLGSAAYEDEALFARADAMDDAEGRISALETALSRLMSRLADAGVLDGGSAIVQGDRLVLDGSNYSVVGDMLVVSGATVSGNKLVF